MEELFLLACPQVFIVVVDTAVLALLLGVVAVHCLVKQFVVHLLNRFIPVHNIQAAALRVYVFSGETSPVMVEGAGAPHCGNGSFQSHVLSLEEGTGAGHGKGFVTFVESKRKSTFDRRSVHQKMPLRPAGGFRLRTGFRCTSPLPGPTPPSCVIAFTGA